MRTNTLNTCERLLVTDLYLNYSPNLRTYYLVYRKGNSLTFIPKIQINASEAAAKKVNKIYLCLVCIRC